MIYNGGQNAGDKTLKVTVDTSADNNENSGSSLALTFTAGNGHFIKGQTGANELDTTNDGAKTTTIILSGDKTDAAQPTLTIGAKGTGTAGDHIALTISDLYNIAGTVYINGQGAEKSSLTATNIQIGGDVPGTGDSPATVASGDPVAVVSLGASGNIIGAESGSFLIKTGGELQFAGADSVAEANSGLTIDGGAVTVADSATGTIEGALTMNSGKLTVSGGAKATSLKVTSSATIKDGALKVASGGTAGGSLTFEKGCYF